MKIGQKIVLVSFFIVIIFSFLILSNIIVEEKIITRLVRISKIHNLLINPEKLVTKYDLRTRENSIDIIGNFTFVHLGHTRAYTFRDRNLEKIPEIINRLNPDFILHSGDLVENPSYLKDCNPVVFKNIKVPIFISPSNHESYDEYRNYRRLIRDELWYSFDVGIYHFVVVAYMETSEEQVRWFIGEIKNNENVIVLLGGQKNNFFEDIIRDLNSNVILVLGGDGQAYDDKRINNTPYLISNEYFLRKITVSDGEVSWETYKGLPQT